MDKRRKLRTTYLTPMCSMTVGEIIGSIERMGFNRACAVLRAFESVSQTNCGWVSYQISKRFMADVLDRIAFIKRKNTKRVKTKTVDTRPAL